MTAFFPLTVQILETLAALFVMAAKLIAIWS
jgi:hypothetical protein